MKEFLRKHEARIHGVLSCFDRMLFRGYLPIMSGWSMAQFLKAHQADPSSIKPFLLENAERVKAHAIALAKKHQRPFEYLASPIRKEDAARKLAERDGIEHGLVCVFSVLEPCRTFSLHFQQGGVFVQSARRKCLHLYFYFMDRDFGLIHVRVQSWFPLQIQIYLNGHEWLARKLAAHQIRYTKHDNVFLWIEDIARAQRFADRFANLNWRAILNQYAKRLVPQLHDLLHGCQYYWVSAQSEYSTDVLFKSRQNLCELYPQLLSHSTLCFGAKEVMNFLGRKLNGHFEGEIVSDLSSLVCRAPVARESNTVLNRTGSRCMTSPVWFFGSKPSSTILSNSGYANGSCAMASSAANGSRCAKGWLIYFDTVRSRYRPTRVTWLRWPQSMIPHLPSAPSIGSLHPSQMPPGVVARASIPWRAMMRNCSKA